MATRRITAARRPPSKMLSYALAGMIVVPVAVVAIEAWALGSNTSVPASMGHGQAVTGHGPAYTLGVGHLVTEPRDRNAVDARSFPSPYTTLNGAWVRSGPNGVRHHGLDRVGDEQPTWREIVVKRIGRRP
jgi:hypothetical protein